MSKITLIKKDAIVKIEIGTGFLQRLQKLMLDMASEITPEQLEEYKKLSENKQPFTEDWKEHLTTITILLKEIEQKAIEQGCTFEEDGDTTLSSMTEEN